MEIQDQPVKDCLEMVAAARTLADPLRAGRVSTGQLARVQRRRWLPTVILQAVQRQIHSNVIAAAAGGSNTAPRGVRVVGRSLALRRLAGYLVAIGPLPERAPRYARRRG
jgi:hypothetical protein